MLQLSVAAEFIPYVFQVLALMLEMHAEGAVSLPYLALFPHLLLPVLWSRDGNIPPLVRLLQAYISRGVRQIEPDKLASHHLFSEQKFLMFKFMSLLFVYFFILLLLLLLLLCFLCCFCLIVVCDFTMLLCNASSATCVGNWEYVR